MSLAIIVLVFVTLQRAGELVLAQANTSGLMKRGGIEIGASHYPVMVALHAGWLAALWFFGWGAEVNLWLLAAYVLLQVFRIWILATLGRRWTTRIIIVPGETLVAGGPYRFLRHPNYLLVLLEVPLLPLALGLPWLALAFGLLNVAMLAWRIRIEEGALSELRGIQQR
jgi:methyltransferase